MAYCAYWLRQHASFFVHTEANPSFLLKIQCINLCKEFIMRFSNIIISYLFLNLPQCEHNMINFCENHLHFRYLMMFAKALVWLEGKVFPAGLLLPFIIASSKFQNFPISFLLGKESLEVLYVSLPCFCLISIARHRSGYGGRVTELIHYGSIVLSIFW